MASRPLWFSPPAAADLPLRGRCDSEYSAGSSPSRDDDDDESIPTRRGTPVPAAPRAPPSTPPPPARSPLARATRRGIHHHNAAAAESAAARLDALHERMKQLDVLVARKPALEAERQQLTDGLQRERRHRREVDRSLGKVLAGADASMVAARERLTQAKKPAGRRKLLPRTAVEPERTASTADMEDLHGTLLDALPMSALMGEVDGPWTCKYRQISPDSSVPELARHLAGSVLASRAELSSVEERKGSALLDFEQRSMEFADLESQSMFVHNLIEEKRNATQHLVANCSKLEETIAKLGNTSKNHAKGAGAVIRNDKAAMISSPNSPKSPRRVTVSEKPRPPSPLPASHKLETLEKVRAKSGAAVPGQAVISSQPSSPRRVTVSEQVTSKQFPTAHRRGSAPTGSAHTQKTSFAIMPIPEFKKKFESLESSRLDPTAAANPKKLRRAPTAPQLEKDESSSDSDSGSSAKFRPTLTEPAPSGNPSTGGVAGTSGEKTAAPGEAAKIDVQLAKPSRMVLTNCSLLKVKVQINQADTDHWARVYAAVATTCREFMPQVGFLAELHRQQCDRRQEELDLCSRLRQVHNPFSVYFAHRRFMAESRLQSLQLVRQRLAGAALVELQRVQDSLNAHWTFPGEDTRHASPLARLVSFGLSHQGGAGALCSVAACLCALDFYVRAELAEVPPAMAKDPGDHAVRSERFSPHAFMAAEDGRLGRQPPMRPTDAGRARTGEATAELDVPKPKAVKRVSIVVPGETAEKTSCTSATEATYLPQAVRTY